MARFDRHNHSQLWADPDIAGLLMLRADFTTHEYAPHVHDELVIAVTERGGSEFRSRGVNELAEPQSVLVFNPGEPHSGRMAGSDRWRYRAFYLDEAALGRLAGDLEIAAQALPYFLTNKLADPALSRELLALHRAAEAGGPALGRECALLAALARLFDRHGAPSPRRVPASDEPAGVAAAVDLLAARYAEDIALGELAEASGISTFRLIRAFNKALGLSPHAFLTQLRVKRAARLLQGGEPPAEVAVAVGFYDQSALNRHFKRTYGVTPGQYVAALKA